ncbi:hypothetical protein M8C21_032404 [Ambrosia artemisiifolia]|uniref:Uncharacterized protein n=1 Tax=Ambrosia artemisiifolia TaxID=4212 RepID=A0AAD5D970_AMBAR|nr:hypothetical protein M8C21_032404 [Ambrosia artemisiifolia]
MRSMDNLTLNASSSPQNKLVLLGFKTNPFSDGTISNKPLSCSFNTPKRSSALYISKSFTSTPRAITKSNAESLGKDWSVRSSSSSNHETSSEVGSILLWVGLGVALSPVFSSAASYLKKYAMTLMEEMDKQNNKSATAGLSNGSDAKSATAGLSNGSDAKSASVTIVAPPGFEIELKQVNQSAAAEQGSAAASPTAKKCLVTVVLPAGFKTEVTQNNQSGTSQGSSAATSAVTVDLPLTKTEAKPAPAESEDDIEILKDSKKSGISQSPLDHQQLQDMLSNAGIEWDNRIIDKLKDFDLTSPELWAEFDEILANPDALTALKNPRIQAAILDLAVEDPLNLNKYKDDKEVMDGINKLRELLPRATDAP